MSNFIPCQGKTACRDDGERCLTCGRSLDEIDRLRQLLDQLAELALEYGYDNVDDFTTYVARKLNKAITYRREQAAEADING